MKNSGLSTEHESPSPSHQVTFLFDVDNTLIDNDAVKTELNKQLEALIGDDAACEFWDIYEQVRQDTGLVDIPETIERFIENSDERDRNLLYPLADLMIDFPFADYVFPGAFDVLTKCQTLGKVAILSDGDSIFQLNKIGKAGLSQAVNGQIMVFDDKTAQFRRVSAAYPASHYVIVDDKPSILAAAQQHLSATTTVWVKKGHYANQPENEVQSEIDIEVAEIAELLDIRWDGIFIS